VRAELVRLTHCLSRTMLKFSMQLEINWPGLVLREEKRAMTYFGWISVEHLVGLTDYFCVVLDWSRCVTCVMCRSSIVSKQILSSSTRANRVSA
jgi:hypothetical protein